MASRKWAAVERWDEQQRLVEAISAAGDAAEIASLLAANRELVTSSLVEDALVEVREHIRGTSPFPRAFRLPLARHILDVNLRVAGFLQDRILVARCLQERGSVRLMSGESAPAAGDLRAASTRWRDLGNSVEAGRCAGLVGDALVAMCQPQACSSGESKPRRWPSGRTPCTTASWPDMWSGR